MNETKRINHALVRQVEESRADRFAMGDGPPLHSEDVKTYPRPPALQRVPQRVRAMLAGKVLFDTFEAKRVLETHHAPTYYIPISEIAPGVLKPARRGTSLCEWKGRAAYFDLHVNGLICPNAAWCYPQPTDAFMDLEEHVAFYALSLDAAWVGEHKVKPQAGDFYGGWVTPNLTGAIKGAAGTLHW